MSKDQSKLLERITLKSGLMGGKPTIRGLRFPVGDILEMLSSGMTEVEILEQHPVLEREDISAALLYASLKMKNTVVIHAWSWNLAWHQRIAHPCQMVAEQTGIVVKSAYSLGIHGLTDIQVYEMAKETRQHPTSFERFRLCGADKSAGLSTQIDQY